MATTISGRNAVIEKQRYILRESAMPFGGGLFIGKGTAEQYKKARHLMTDEKEVIFMDARAADGGLSFWDFDTHGLCCITPPPAIDFANDPAIYYMTRDRNAEMGVSKKPEKKPSKLREVYYPALCELAKKLTGAKECFLESHAMREPNPKNIFANPSRFAHSDASARSPPIFRNTLVKRFGYSEEEANSVDICSFNIWHPIEYPAYRDPLCLLDSSSVDIDRDIAPIPYVDTEGKQVKMNSGFELEGPCFNPSHRWVYISDQKPDEAWVFKQWDTRDGVAKQCYHNSFHDPFYDNANPAKSGRKSIEFRMLLVFPKKATAKL